MLPINGTTSCPAPRATGACSSCSLRSFTDKIAMAGDLASECMLLLSKDSSVQAKLGKSGIRTQRRVQRDARRLRMEQLEKYWKAASKSGFWSKLAGFFKNLSTALSAALTVFGGPAVAVGLGGALVSGVCKTGAAVYSENGTRARTAMMKSERQKETAREIEGEWLGLFEEAAGLENRMVKRINELLESESKSQLARWR